MSLKKNTCKKKTCTSKFIKFIFKITFYLRITKEFLKKKTTKL